jgi:hypothetical protein
MLVSALSRLRSSMRAKTGTISVPAAPRCLTSHTHRRRVLPPTGFAALSALYIYEGQPSNGARRRLSGSLVGDDLIIDRHASDRRLAHEYEVRTTAFRSRCRLLDAQDARVVSRLISRIGDEVENILHEVLDDDLSLEAWHVLG